MAKKKSSNRHHKKYFPLKGNLSWPAVLAIGCLWVGYQVYQEYAFPIIVQEQQNIEMRTCFVPNHSCRDRLIHVIDNAQTEILVMCYNFNDEKIAEALIQARDRGILVALVTDKTQRSHTHSQIPLLRRKNIPVYSDDKVAIAHNKVLIIDEKITVTGSFNLTDSAQQRNAENLLFVTSKNLAQQYKSYWRSRQDLSQKLHPD